MGLSDITDALGITGAQSAPPALTRPTASVSFGGGGAVGSGALGALGDAVGWIGGGAGDLASAAASAIGLGAGGGDDPWARSMVALTVDVGVAPAIDIAQVELRAGGDAPVVAVGDAGTIALDDGAGSGSAVVFTGDVERVGRAVDGATRFVATNGAAALAALRVNQSYEGRSAGEIVSDLAGRAGVTTGTIEDGIDVAFWVAHDRVGAWNHIARLATASGYLALFSAEGELSFGPLAPGGPQRTFTGGQDVVGFDAAAASVLVDAVTVVGDGAAGSDGQDAASWFVKDPGALRVTSGSGALERVRSDPALRSVDASRSAADGMALRAALSAGVGRVTVPGAPVVRPGAAIAMAGLGDGFDGTYLVLRVCHRFDVRKGFVSILDVALLAAGAGGAASVAGGTLGAAAAALGGL